MDQLHQPANRRSGANGGGRRVYALLRAQMADGSLAVGARLPSTRALAADLGVARSTVTVAYEQLAAEGFVATAPGRSARVAAPLAPETAAHSKAGPGRLHASALSALSAYGQRVAAMELLTARTSAAAPAPIDFLYGAVAARDFPTLAWKRAYQAELLRQQPSLYYGAPEGDSGLRQALQGYLRRARGLACCAEQIGIVKGAQQAIALCARLLLDADSAYAFEDPGYAMARRCFEASGARGLAVAVDSLGMDTASLPVDARLRLAYVTPSHQFPLGGVLPIGRRQELLRWARQQDAWIIEDDYDGEFRYGQRPIDALQSMDTDGRVLYIGTFSKALSPQLRLAYMVLPESLVALFRKAKRLADRHAPVIEQRVLAALLDSGAYERHVRRMRRENERRRNALLDAIRRHLPADAKVAGSAAGLHLVLWLPALRPRHEPQLIAAARAAGVGVYAVSPLFARPPGAMAPRPAGLILGYASLTLAQIDAGMQRLAGALAALA
jgi:GntR family transcriptional regulator/MocR family aminotransferase